MKVGRPVIATRVAPVDRENLKAKECHDSQTNNKPLALDLGSVPALCLHAVASALMKTDNQIGDQAQHQQLKGQCHQYDRRRGDVKIVGSNVINDLYRAQ